MDKFEQLKNRYISSFEQKKANLDSAWQEKDIEKVESLLHKLAGSSGSYGFDQLSQLCRQTMDCVSDDLEVADSVQFEQHLQAIFAEMDDYI